MATSLLFSPDMLSTYNPVPPSKLIGFSSTVDQWSIPQSPTHRSTHQQTPRNMTTSNGNNNTTYSQSNTRTDELGEYTFTTHAPNNDEFSHWPNNTAYPGPLTLQTEILPRLPPSPHYSGENWSDYPNFSDQTSNSPTYNMLNGYSPESASTLSAFNIPQPRSPSHISPTGSDPTLSPLYSASPGLAPSTPGSTYMPSPVMNDGTNMLVLDPSATTGNGNLERPLLSHREQLMQFREVVNRQSDSNFGPFLPQQMYKPHTTSDRKRYVEEVLLEAPIYFKTEHPYQDGILLKDALHSRTKKLLDRDQVVFEGRGPSVSIRLEWPGYRQWSRQIPTKDFRSPPQPITLAKLAKNIAKCVQRFMLDRKTQQMEEESDQRWKIGDGPHDIKLEDLILVSIHHVSLGSWQPHLRLVRPLRQHRQSHGQSMSMARMPGLSISLPPMNGPLDTVSFSQLS